MHLSTLLALPALASLGLAATVPAQGANMPKVPDLPNGYFTGVNNADGTTTMTFESGESYTFVPKKPETPAIQKRVYFDCWRYQQLNHAGVSKGVDAMNDRLSFGDGFWVGSPYGPPYAGYNNDGVFVYFCRNDRSNNAALVNKGAMDFANSEMDRACGLWSAGYMRFDNSALIYGRTLSGTAICLDGV